MAMAGGGERAAMEMMADVNDPKRISRSAFVRETMAAMEATAPSAEVLEQVQARKSKGNELFGRKKFPAALVEYAPLPPLPLPLLRPPPHAAMPPLPPRSWPKLRAPRGSPCTAEFNVINANFKVTWKTYRNLFYLKRHVIMTRDVRGISVGYPLRYPLRGVVYPLGLQILLIEERGDAQPMTLLLL